MTTPETTRRRPRGTPKDVPSEIVAVTASPRPQPAPIVVSAPRPRPITDFAGLQAIADLDRASIVAAMNAAIGGGGTPGALKAGQRVVGRISTIGHGAVFVDVGGKADAVIDRLELGEVQIGDRVEAFVHSTDGGEVRLTRTPSGSAAREMMKEAMAEKLVMEGKVSAVAESGWQVALSDGIRAFCPGSHAGVSEVASAEHVGQTFRFHIHDLRGSDVVLSRRAIVEAEEQAEERAKLGAVREGDVHDAVVVSVRDFGAFVRLSNGVEGLVHASNLAETRPKHPSELVKEGDAVRVRVLGIDREKRRIDLGIRQAVDMSSKRPGHSSGGGFDVFASLLKDVRVKR